MALNAKALVVVPTYNECENIPTLLAAIWTALPNLHVLVVDDGSPDGTGALIKARQQTELGRLHLIERSGKQGLGTAYIRGFRWALEQGYDFIIEMDADLSHDPADLAIILKELESSDVVIGSRYVPHGGTMNWSPIRKFISLAGSLYARTILGMSIRDLTGGFNGWRRSVLETIALDGIRSGGYSFQIELKYRAQCAGFSLKEFPILFTERRAGQSKMSAHIVAEAIFQVWRMRFS